MSEQLKKI